MQGWLPRFGTMSFFVALPLLVACAPRLPSPAIGGGHVAIQSDYRGKLTLLDLASGRVVESDSDGFSDAPPIFDDLLFAHGSGGLVARRLSDGTAAWRVFSKTATYRPLVSGGGRVFVYAEKAGAARWRGFDAKTGRSAFDIPCDGDAMLATGADSAATFRDGELAVLDLSEGKERYRVAGEMDPPVLVAGEHITARSGEALVVIKAENGRVLRKVELGSSEPFETRDGRATHLAVSADLVAYLADDEVFGIELDSGKSRFRTPVADVSALGMSAGFVVVLAGEELIGLDAVTGSKRWAAPLESEALSVDVGEGQVAVRTSDARLMVFDLASGKRKYSVEIR